MIACLPERHCVAEAILEEEMDVFYQWMDGRDLIPRIQEIRAEAETDLSLRLHRILAKLPLGEAGELEGLDVWAKLTQLNKAIILCRRCRVHGGK